MSADLIITLCFVGPFLVFAGCAVMWEGFRLRREERRRQASQLRATWSRAPRALDA